MGGSSWSSRGDVVIDCSRFRLPYEWVIRRRGTHAVGKYGEGVARRWLVSIGVRPTRHHAFITHGVPSMHPDLFDQSTGVAYEVKTGKHQLTNATLGQILAYGRALRT